MSAPVEFTSAFPRFSIAKAPRILFYAVFVVLDAAESENLTKVILNETKTKP